jgi:MFS superfamily sulfate permease-like transporter
MTGWLPGYQHDSLRFDVIAGMTVASVIIPAAMVYARSAKVIGDQWRVIG